MKPRRVHILVLAVAMWLPAGSGIAQDAGDTERKLRELRKELKQIGSERRRLEGQRGSRIAASSSPSSRSEASGRPASAASMRSRWPSRLPR